MQENNCMAKYKALISKELTKDGMLLTHTKKKNFIK